MARKLLTLIAALLLLTACSSGDSNPIFPTIAPGTPTTRGDSGPIGTSATGAPTTTSAASAVVPVPLREGLASFDAYVVTFSVATSGPSADEYIQSTNRVEYDRESNSRILMSDTTQDGPDFDGPETTTQNARTAGNITCTFDGTEWTYSEMTDQEREMTQLAERLIDFVPVIEDPVEVGRGEVVGIPAIHYTFTPSGLGQTSGAITEVSTAEYWVSVDGAVLLSYHLVASSRNGPTGDADTQAFTLDMKADLVDTTGPGVVSLPQECLDQAP